MITFSKLGRRGKLGNQLHQVASLIGLSEKYNCELILPEWNYAGYFKHPPKQGDVQPDFFVEEKDFHYTPEFWDRYAEIFRTKQVDILGWLQSEKYWEHCKEKVHRAFQFNDELIHKLKLKYQDAFCKKTIAVSIRRGDFVTNPNHYLLPLNYYIKALLTFFPDYKNYSIIIFSDDMRYCLFRIRHLPNIFFAKGLDAIEQLCLMSLCEHFIISNSTFSWWGAMLGEKAGSKIVHSPYVVAGNFEKKLNTKDYYPERWVSFEHLHVDKDIRAFDVSKAQKLLYKLVKKSAVLRNKLFRIRSFSLNRAERPR